MAYHASLSATLLGLEEDGLLVVATRAVLVGAGKLLVVRMQLASRFIRIIGLCNACVAKKQVILKQCRDIQCKKKKEFDKKVDL